MDNDPTPEQREAIRAYFERIHGRAPGAQPVIGALPEHPLLARLDALVAAIQAQTAAIEGLVASVAASLPDEPPEPEDGYLSRPR